MTSPSVIPAKAGISRKLLWIPAYAGMTILLSACAADDTGPAPVYNAMVEQHNPNLGAHMVSRDESLQQIASNYKVTIDDILRANNLSSPQEVAAGQRLYMPESPTLSSLADAGPVQTFTQKAGNGANDDNNNGGPMLSEAQPLEPLPSSGPIQSESLAPLGSPAPSASAVTPSPMATPAPVASAPAAPAPVAAEPVRVASALSPDKWTSPLANGFRWPVKGPTLSSYGEKADGLRNDGINIGALEGSAVESAADGEVVYTGQAVDGFGNLVLIKHKDNLVTAYGHLSRIDVSKGQTVHAGDIIGGVGQSGSVNAPQLHFEIRKGSEILNPIQYLKTGSTQTAGL